MATILAYTSPAIGHLYPMVPLLLELQGRGHEVKVRTLASQVPVLRSLDFDAERIDGRIEKLAHDDHMGKSTADRVARTARVLARRGVHDAADILAAIDQCKPDFVLVDVNCWGAPFAVDRLGAPWALFRPPFRPFPRLERLRSARASDQGPVPRETYAMP